MVKHYKLPVDLGGSLLIKSGGQAVDVRAVCRAVSGIVRWDAQDFSAMIFKLMFNIVVILDNDP
jgi:hypothetical protein